MSNVKGISRRFQDVRDKGDNKVLVLPDFPKEFWGSNARRVWKRVKKPPHQETREATFLTPPQQTDRCRGEMSWKKPSSGKQEEMAASGNREKPKGFPNDLTPHRKTKKTEIRCYQRYNEQGKRSSFNRLQRGIWGREGFLWRRIRGEIPAGQGEI